MRERGQYRDVMRDRLEHRVETEKMKREKVADTLNTWE